MKVIIIILKEQILVYFTINTGHVNPIEDEHEPSSGSNEWGISMTDQTAVGDFNGDDLEDVMFAHRYDPNKSTWKADAPAILLLSLIHI